LLQLSPQADDDDDSLRARCPRGVNPIAWESIAMISNADVVVIGSGGTGAATAYALSKRGELGVALLDKHDIGSQTSPRAAGMVSCARKGDLMTMLIMDACRKIETFTEETGQPLDWVHSGSLKIARRPQDAEVIKADFERGRRMGLDVELISPEQASCLNPFLKATGVVGAMMIGDDRYSIRPKSPLVLLALQKRTVQPCFRRPMWSPWKSETAT
jgi:hypothetical protein